MGNRYRWARGGIPNPTQLTGGGTNWEGLAGWVNSPAAEWQKKGLISQINSTQYGGTNLTPEDFSDLTQGEYLLMTWAYSQMGKNRPGRVQYSTSRSLGQPQTPKASSNKPTNTPQLEVPTAAGAANTQTKQAITAKSTTPQTDPDIFSSYNTNISNGKVTIAGKQSTTGKFDYVITTEDVLKIGTGHFKLSGGAPTVQAAGQLSIKNGTVSQINNSSGHYKPTVLEGKGSVEALDRLGVNTQNAQKLFYGQDGKLVETIKKENKIK